MFRTKNGKKRRFDFRLTIDTKNSEARLERVKGLLTEISTLAKGINLTIAAPTLGTKKIKANAKSLYEKKAVEARNAKVKCSASSSVTTMAGVQKRITKAMGKINPALSHLERDRNLTIKTDVSEQRLRSILTILNRIKNASTIKLNISGGLPAGMTGVSASGTPGVMPFDYTPSMQAPVPYATTTFAMLEKKPGLMQKLYISQQMHRQRMAHEDARFNAEQHCKAQMSESTEAEKRRQAEAQAHEQACCRAQHEAERQHKQAGHDRRRTDKAARQQQQRNAMQSARTMQRQNTATGTLYRSKHRAAINRIQYSQAPSLRNLPFASMINAYMGYLVRNELTKVIEYSNIMGSAHSILQVAGTDLKTFETRFDNKARRVRKIGIDIKYSEYIQIDIQ